MKRLQSLCLFFSFCTLLFSENRTLQTLDNNDIGWKLQTDDYTIHIIPYASDIVEVIYLPPGEKTIDPSHSVILKPLQPIKQDLKETTSGYELQSGNLSILISQNPYKLSFSRNGESLANENGGFFLNDERGIKFSIEDNEKIYGAGERAVPLDRRGYKVPLYNRASYGYQMEEVTLNYGIPMISSSKKYAILYDNPQKGSIDIAKEDPNAVKFSTMGGTIRYYLIAGNDWQQIMENYTLLTGRQEVPPRWALGNFMSRMAYRTQAETDSILNLMLEKKFPVDAVIVDFYWFGDSIQGHLGRLDWYKPSWPDPEKMIADFNEKGVKTILITEPYIVDTIQPNYQDAVDKDILVKDKNGKVYLDTMFYFGNASLIDIFKPEAQDWFWEKYDKQIKKGVASWWGDLGEPESHPSEIRHVIGTADEVHNIYGHYWAKMVFEKYKKHYPEQRLFSLMRAGYAGTQRYNIYPWTGDVGRSWSSMEAQFPILLSMGMNGLGYIHSDAGGFAVADKKDDELYTRWLQFACFTPILRAHGSYMESEPVYFSEQTQEIVRNYMQLRYAFLPYNYSIAYENAQTGIPLMRPLYFYHPDDTIAQSISDSYYWGPNVLVAPIYKPGETVRKVYLPEGKWMHVNGVSGDHEIYAGGKWHDIDVDIKEMPIFIRFGAFIPLHDDSILTTRDYSSDEYEVVFVPSETETTFVQYEDDGLTNAPLENRKAELFTYKGKKEEDKVWIHLSSKDWQHQEGRRMTFEVWDTFSEVWFNNELVMTKDDSEQNFFNSFSFIWNGEDIHIELK